MMSKGRFVANENNLGGKNAIRRQLLEHHNAIVHAKPAVDSRIKPPTHVDKNVDPKKKLARREGAFAFNEVYHSFKKVATIKEGYIDDKKPETFDLTKNRLPKNKKAIDFATQEHMRHLKSQQQRINGIGKSMTERKKNLFDPIAHPVTFFRRANEPNKDTSVDFMFSKVVGAARTSTTGFNVSQMKNKLTKRPLSSMNRTGSIIEEDDLLKAEPSLVNTFGKNKEEEIPEFSGKMNDDEAFRNYKLKVIDHIIEKRLYKALDLDILHEKIKLKYPDIDKEKLEAMFEQINIDLDR